MRKTFIFKETKKYMKQSFLRKLKNTGTLKPSFLRKQLRDAKYPLIKYIGRLKRRKICSTEVS